jgi:sec-independent protein translocase protein TatC
MSVSTQPPGAYDRREPDDLLVPEETPAMSFGEHLEELRRRLIYALVGLVPIFALCLVFGTTLMELILRPLQNQLRAANLPVLLQATGPMETFSAWVKVALIVSLVVGIPLALYQLWLFIAPGLYAHERRFARFLVPLSIALAGLGLAFLYFVLLPAALAFVLNFGAGVGRPHTPIVDMGAGGAGGAMVMPMFPVVAGDPADPAPGAVWFNLSLQELRMNVAVPSVDGSAVPAQIRGTPMTRAVGIAQQFRISQYLSLVFNMSLAVSLGFQMPVAVLLLGWAGVVTPAVLRKNRKYAILFCSIAAAMLTPPDPLSLFLLWLPLIVLYEFGILLLVAFPPSRVAEGFSLRKRAMAAKEPADAGDA